MKTTGIKRRIDHSGRFVFPDEVREALDIKPGDKMEIFARGKDIILRRTAQGRENADELKELANE